MLSLNIMLFSEDQLKKVYYWSTYSVSHMTDTFAGQKSSDSNTSFWIQKLPEIKNKKFLFGMSI